jgi:hypothetical protein
VAAKAVAVEAEEERGLAMRIPLHSPKIRWQARSPQPLSAPS